MVIVDVYWKRAPRLALKLPNDLKALGLATPFPQLGESWDLKENEFGWTISSLASVPDVEAAIDLVAPFHPENGPMLAPTSVAGER